MTNVTPTIYGFEIESFNFFADISVALENMVLDADKKTMSLEDAINLIKSKCKEYEVDQKDMDTLIQEFKKMW